MRHEKRLAALLSDRERTDLQEMLERIARLL